MSNYPISVDVTNPEGYNVMAIAALTQSCQHRFERAVDRLWFRYNPPRTEWWVKLAQWCIRRGQQIVGHYRYWRYMRGIEPNNWYFNYFHYDADKGESTLKSKRL